MKDEVGKIEVFAVIPIHPSSFRLHPFLSDAAASDLDRQDQRCSVASAD